MKKLEVIDYLRGFSIFTIVLMHLIQSYSIPSILQKASSFGGAGVHVFILCSGFGLYLSHLNKPLSYSNFLKRRFIKVYIPYILIILLSAAIPFYNHSDNKLLELSSHIFLFKMFFESLESSLGYQMWFISTIIQFYLLWPFMLRLSHKGGILSLIISILYGIFIAIIGVNDQRIWNSFFLQYLWEFVLGMKLAEVYYKTPETFKIPSLKLLFITAGIGILLTGIAGIKGGWFKVFNDIPSLAGYLSTLLITYKIFPKIWRKFIFFTNKISYEWYLVHILVFACCDKLLPTNNILISATISLISSYLIAYLYSGILRIIPIK